MSNDPTYPTRMQLRSGSVVGSHLLPPAARPAFEEGARLLFQQWTALRLAVENQWGGQNSDEKAQWLLQDTIQWFYKTKEHYADDLEVELDDAMLQDFNVEAEDNSPMEMAKALVSFYTECLQGNSAAAIERLRAQAALAAQALAKSKKQTVDRDGTVMDADGMDESSSDEDGDDDDCMDEDGDAPQGVPMQQQQQEPKEKPAPIVDEDGFTMVQGKGRKGRR